MNQQHAELKEIYDKIKKKIKLIGLFLYDKLFNLKFNKINRYYLMLKQNKISVMFYNNYFSRTLRLWKVQTYLNLKSWYKLYFTLLLFLYIFLKIITCFFPLLMLKTSKSLHFFIKRLK